MVSNGYAGLVKGMVRSMEVKIVLAELKKGTASIGVCDDGEHVNFYMLHIDPQRAVRVACAIALGKIDYTKLPAKLTLPLPDIQKL